MLQTLKRWVRDLQDFTATQIGLRDPTLPPRRLIRVSTWHDFESAGRSWMRRIVDIGGLAGDAKVLEVGCGSGRVARCLIDHLASGEYHGFDIRADEIAWLQAHIAGSHANFHFQHVDLRNEFYNPNGAIDPSTFRFPYADASFDFVYLTSIFTHLLPADVCHYLGEIRRVLRPGGRCFASYFLLDGGVRERIAKRQACRRFAHPITDWCRSDNEQVSEQALAYDLDWLLARHQDAGLELDQPPHFGTWSLDPEADPTGSYQDVLLARRPAASLTASADTASPAAAAGR